MSYAAGRRPRRSIGNGLQHMAQNEVLILTLRAARDTTPPAHTAVLTGSLTESLRPGTPLMESQNRSCPITLTSLYCVPLPKHHQKIASNVHIITRIKRSQILLSQALDRLSFFVAWLMVRGFLTLLGPQLDTSGMPSPAGPCCDIHELDTLPQIWDRVLQSVAIIHVELFTQS